MTDNKILEITTDVKWIGVLDPDIRTFDIVMETKFGSTYNSYFINATKKVIVDTVKEKFWEVYLAKLLAVVKPEEIEYIIINHTEPDHSGNLENLLKIAKNAKVVGSGNAIRYLLDLIGHEFQHVIVKDGDKIDLGNKTLQFIGAPNLHWPDTMYSYLVEDKVLFTCDSFGAHYCNPEMFCDKVGDYDESFKYYFDVIMKPYSKFMLKGIEKIRPLEIAALCTGHGPLHTTNWDRYIGLTQKYATEALAKPEKHKIALFYVSAYHNTEKVAHKIIEGIKTTDVEVEMYDIEKMPPAEIDEIITNSTAIIIGSPTISQNTFYQIYNVFAVINPIRDRGKLYGSFGSYGWSGEGPKIVDVVLTSLKLKKFDEPFTFKFTAYDEVKDFAVDYGKRFAEVAAKYCLA